jgi:putative RNA 2'-phosphotransferase
MIGFHMNASNPASKKHHGLDLTELSRTVSHALRHEPWLYELEIDEEGWTSLSDLTHALRSEKPEWGSVNEIDISQMIGASSKRRHEIVDGRIRALYGHSVPEKLKKSPAVPTDTLYHGTAPDTASVIRDTGLLPIGRQYVHLSTDKDTAIQVGKRKSKTPIILRVLVEEAHANKIQFYKGNERVWLADYVPAQFIIFDDCPSQKLNPRS